MSLVNSVSLIGRLGSDPEIITFDGGGKLANVSLATDRRYKKKDSNEVVHETDWHRLVFNSKLADLAEKFLTKGDKVALRGELRTRSYTNNSDQKIFITEIVVREVEFLETKGKEKSVNNNNDSGSQNPADYDDDLPF